MRVTTAWFSKGLYSQVITICVSSNSKNFPFLLFGNCLRPGDVTKRTLVEPIWHAETNVIRARATKLGLLVLEGRSAETSNGKKK